MISDYLEVITDENNGPSEVITVFTGEPEKNNEVDEKQETSVTSADLDDEGTILDVPDMCTSESVYITPFDTPKDEQSLSDDLVQDQSEEQILEENTAPGQKSAIVSSDSLAHMDSATSSGDTISRNSSLNLIRLFLKYLAFIFRIRNSLTSFFPLNQIDLFQPLRSDYARPRPRSRF